MVDKTVTQARPAQTQAEPTSRMPVYQPRFDIFESENELTLHGDLPGVKEKDLDIRFEGEQLMIQGKVPDRFKDVDLLYQEYGVGDFERTFSIGAAVDAEKITAEIHSG